MVVVGIVIAVLTIFVVSLKSSADGMGGVTDVGMKLLKLLDPGPSTWHQKWGVQNEWYSKYRKSDN